MKRKPAVEGRFYPDSEHAILNLIGEIESRDRFYDLPDRKSRTVGAVLPHAGHIYSGYQTIPFFKYLERENIWPETFIILHPNHSGTGVEIALDDSIAWINSLGEVSLDEELNSLLSYPKDNSAHRFEHSAEVIIPFIQYFAHDRPFKISPICIKRIDNIEVQKLAKNLKLAIENTGRNVMIIASSDFSHFQSPEKGRRDDEMVLERLKLRDIEAVRNVIESKKISVCGYGPILVLMAYAELIDPDYDTTILARGHSGEVYPSKEVVNYISIMFHSKT